LDLRPDKGFDEKPIHSVKRELQRWRREARPQRELL
jgi:hypothetical protein